MLERARAIGEEGPVHAVIYDGNQIAPGEPTPGPCIWMLPDTKIGVPDGWSARRDEAGHALLEAKR